MTKQHPITPPPELVKKWLNEGRHQDYCSASEHAIAQAAQWGADQELEACAQWVEANFGQLPTHNLHQFRRPKAPSLKEQALEALEDDDIDIYLIRRALEALDD
jgi:hypothetical protein